VARKNTQEMSRESARQAVLDAAMVLDAEADVYRPEEEAGLSAQQWQAVALLVAGKKQVEVAQELGITQETVSRWRNGPLFAAALNLAVRDSYAATIGEVRGLVKDAIAALRESMYSEDERLRLSAALSVLRLHLQLDSQAPSLPATPADIARQVRKADYDNMFFS
jgi:predicted transcriptional regulator